MLTSAFIAVLNKKKTEAKWAVTAILFYLKIGSNGKSFFFFNLLKHYPLD